MPRLFNKFVEGLMQDVAKVLTLEDSSEFLPCLGEVDKENHQGEIDFCQKLLENAMRYCGTSYHSPRPCISV